jgi:TPR repeat protein
MNDDKEVIFSPNFLDIFNNAMKEFNDKNYLKAHVLLRSKDIEKYYVAQYWLGYMYFIGLGAEQNYEQASYWFEESARQGYPDAYYMLYYMYNKGLYYEKNEELSKKYYDLYKKFN